MAYQFHPKSFFLILIYIVIICFLLAGSFAGMAYLSLYLAGKLQLFNGRAHVSRVILVLAPLMIALLVGLSRVDDYWHHWQDVFVGALIGIHTTMVTIVYANFSNIFTA